MVYETDGYQGNHNFIPLYGTFLNQHVLQMYYKLNYQIEICVNWYSINACVNDGYHGNHNYIPFHNFFSQVTCVANALQIQLRGYCTAGQFLDCFCTFLKNYNTLVTSKICFLYFIGNISGKLITVLEFHWLKWLLIYGSKHGKYWFSHIFHCNFTTMVSTEAKLWFLSSLEHFRPNP